MRNSKRCLSALAAAAVAVMYLGAPLPASATETDAAAQLLSSETDAGLSSEEGPSPEESDGTEEENGSVEVIYETIEINDREDFEEFAQNCHSDEWSENKYVLLNADLDFGGEEYEPIPTFGGIFDGQGHTVSGIVIEEESYEAGFFGEIRESGIVRNLNVEGRILPEGNSDTIGGITGRNDGTISNCTFSGSIEAQSMAGGVAGRNGIGGYVLNCSTEGSILASSGCGGIVGYNEGTISSCENGMEVNTTYEDTQAGTDDLTELLEAVMTGDILESTESLSDDSDNGGIAGFSSGVITSCVNRGRVGYEHVGYNIGGIVGRSSGYLCGNTNYGEVYGRKDVGGVVGQMQPYLLLSFSEETLDEIEEQLDILGDLMDQMLDSAEGMSDEMSNHLSNISGLIDIAGDAIHEIADEGADSLDEMTDSMNETADKMDQIFSILSTVGDEMDAYMDGVGGALSGMEDLDLSDYLTEISDAVDHLLTELKLAFPDLNSLDFSDAIESALEQLQELLESLAAEQEALKDAIEDAVEDALSGYSSGTQEEEETEEESEEETEEASQYTQSSGYSQEDAGNAWDAGGGSSGGNGAPDPSSAGSMADDRASDSPQANTDGQGSRETMTEEEAQEYLSRIQEIQEAQESLTEMAGELDNAARELDSGNAGSLVSSGSLDSIISETSMSIQRIQQALSELASLISEFPDAMPDLSSLSESISSAQEALTDTDGLTDALDSLTNVMASIDLQINGVSDTMEANGDLLYDTMGQLMDEMEALSDSSTDSMSDMSGDIRSVFDQFENVMDTMLDSVEEQFSADDDEDDEHYVDTSETEGSTYKGRAAQCENYGDVNADLNVGGIVGMVGVESGFDPETDLETSGNTTLNYVLQASCVVRSSVNRGNVTARSNYAGGIAGQMDLGLLDSCENYGTLSCEDSKYVGGIAGHSEGTIRNCTAKCEIEGGSYVGGIAGYGTTLRSNYAMLNIEDPGLFTGAIAGSVDSVDVGSVSGNYYYSETVYGIDGISYQNLAEGVTYEELLRMDGIPDTFSDLVLTFTADDEILGVVTCGYGESVSEEDLPDIPEKEGFYGNWSRTDYSRITSDEVVTAEYTRYRELLASEQARESGLSVIQVDGSFRAEDALTVTQETAQGSEAERWTIVIPEDGNEMHQVRFLVPDDAGSGQVKLYLVQDGKKTQIDTSSLSDYLTFTAEGDEITFAVESAAGRIRTVVIAACAAAAVIVLVLVLYTGLRRSRRKRRKAK